MSVPRRLPVLTNAFYRSVRRATFALGVKVTRHGGSRLFLGTLCILAALILATTGIALGDDDGLGTRSVWILAAAWWLVSGLLHILRGRTTRPTRLARREDVHLSLDVAAAVLMAVLLGDTGRELIYAWVSVPVCGAAMLDDRLGRRLGVGAALVLVAGEIAHDAIGVLSPLPDLGRSLQHAALPALIGVGFAEIGGFITTTIESVRTSNRRLRHDLDQVIGWRFLRHLHNRAQSSLEALPELAGVLPRRGRLLLLSDAALATHASYRNALAAPDREVDPPVDTGPMEPLGPKLAKDRHEIRSSVFTRVVLARAVLLALGAVGAAATIVHDERSDFWRLALATGILAAALREAKAVDWTVARAHGLRHGWSVGIEAQRALRFREADEGGSTVVLVIELPLATFLIACGGPGPNELLAVALTAIAMVGIFEGGGLAFIVTVWLAEAATAVTFAASGNQIAIGVLVAMVATWPALYLLNARRPLPHATDLAILVILLAACTVAGAGLIWAWRDGDHTLSWAQLAPIIGAFVFWPAVMTLRLALDWARQIIGYERLGRRAAQATTDLERLDAEIRTETERLMRPILEPLSRQFHGLGLVRVASAATRAPASAKAVWRLHRTLRATTPPRTSHTIGAIVASEANQIRTSALDGLVIRRIERKIAPTAALDHALWILGQTHGRGRRLHVIISGTVTYWELDRATRGGERSDAEVAHAVLAEFLTNADRHGSGDIVCVVSHLRSSAPYGPSAYALIVNSPSPSSSPSLDDSSRSHGKRGMGWVHEDAVERGWEVRSHALPTPESAWVSIIALSLPTDPELRPAVARRMLRSFPFASAHGLPVNAGDA